MNENQNTPIRIQAFTKAYGQGVLDLILNIQNNEFGIPITASDQPDLKGIPDFYQKGSGNFWVVLCGEQVVGSIALLDIGNHEAALRKMFVNARFRGTGTAKMLLDTLLQWADQKQIRSIYLGTTPKFLAAHRFYEKNGFLEILKTDLPEAFPIMKVDTKFYQYNMA